MQLLRNIALGLALAAPLAGAAPAGAHSARTSTYQAFRTPSGQIGCYYATGPTVLRCDTAYRTRFTGRRRCVQGEYGSGFSMSPRGPARPICRSDTAVDPSAPALAYGRTRRFGGVYSCTSRQSGLTCRNAVGAGWFLSRQRQTLFAARPASTARVRVSVSPRTVRAGSQLTVSGRGWPARSSVQLLVGPPQSEASPVGSVRARADGSFRKVLRVNSRARPGRYVLLACRRSCRVKASATFTIAAAALSKLERIVDQHL